VSAVFGSSNDTDFSSTGALVADGGFIVAGSNGTEVYTNDKNDKKSDIMVLYLQLAGLNSRK